MQITSEQMEQFEALRIYSLSIDAVVHSHSDRPWPTEPIEMRVVLHGYGDTLNNATPTWSAAASDVDLDAALARALVYAPAVRAECVARAAGRLGDILPEYDPDGTRKRTSRKASPSRKIGAAELANLLADL